MGRPVGSIDSARGSLADVVESADARPTQAASDRVQEVRRALNEQLAELRKVLETDLAAFNERVRSTGRPR